MINWHENQANFCVNDSNFNFSRQKLYEKLAQKTTEKKIILHRHVLIQFFLYSLTTDGRMENVVVYNLQKRYSPEKHYVFILEITRENVKSKINL